MSFLWRVLPWVLLAGIAVAADNESLKVSEARLSFLQGRERIEALVTLARDSEQVDPARGLGFAEEALGLAGREGKHTLILDVLLIRANLLMRLSRWAEADRSLDEAQIQAQHSGERVLQGRVLLYSARLHREVCEFEVAIQIALKALAIFEESKDDEQAALTLRQLGTANFRLGRRKEAGDAWRRAYDIYKQRDDCLGMAAMLNNLGVLSKDDARFDEALEYYRKAELLHRERRDPRALSDVINNIAVVHFIRRNLSACEAQNKRALALREELHENRLIAASCFNLGELYLEMKRFDHGLLNLRRARSLSEETQDRLLLADCLKLESRYAEQTGDMSRALGLYKDYEKLRGALFSEDGARKTAMIQAQYELDRQKREIALLRSDQAVRQARSRLLLGGIVALAVIFGMVVMRYRLKLRTGARIDAQNRELETMDRIVRSINTEVDLPGVFGSMLSQALELFPQADKSGLLVLDAETGLFRFAAVRGAAGPEMEVLLQVRLSPEEARARYAPADQALSEDIFLTRDFQDLGSTTTLASLPVPLAMLSVMIVMENETVAYLVLDSNKSPEAFGSSDLARLRRFKEHAILALLKARALDRTERALARAEHALEKLRRAYSRQGTISPKGSS